MLMRFFSFLRWISFLCLLFLAGCAGLSKDTRYTAEDTSRTIDLTVPPLDAWERIRRGYAIPNLNTPLVDKWTAYYASHPEAMQRMATRAGKYLYYIVDEINRRGLPTELALLPFVESAYNPIAFSSAKAAGLWQFIPSTGTQFKLKQDWWHDQRRDPIASTNAALDYLEYLFEFQGDWYLALASYNWGEGSVKRAVTRNLAAGKPTDYLSLNMPDETRNYVPKLQAIKNIVGDPEKYAVLLPQVDNEPYFVAVKKSVDIDFTVAAELAEMPIDDFKALNPSFNQALISAIEEHSVILPKDKVDIFNANLAEYKGELSSWKVYEAKQGETYSSIASKFGISESRLREANRIPQSVRSASDQSLMIPSPAGQGIQLAPPSASRAPQIAGKAVRASKAETNNARVRTHVVKKGDTLESIARQYGTNTSTLRSLNNLKNDNVKLGSKLRIPGTGTRG
jgi:membrane-bound lytic murein transglycosylase D